MRSILQMGDSIASMDTDRLEDRRANTSAALFGPLSKGSVAESRTVGGRPALWISPVDLASSKGNNVVLYLHGGAFEVGSPRDYQAFCSRLALRLRAAVVVPDYGLAPEHPFPAAVDDVLAAYSELVADVPPSNLALIGDSAGGGLVCSCLIAVKRAQLPQPAAAAAISAWADLTSEPASRSRCAATDPFLSTEHLQRAADQYLVDADPQDPLASPARASADELAELAPILLQVAGNEILADDSIDLADAIAKAGGTVSLEVTGEAFHVWHMAGDDVPEARQAFSSLCGFVADRWANIQGE